MKPKEFISQLDEPRIVEAIRKAESTTTGEIRVLISRHLAPDAMSEAEKQFMRLGMHRTKGRNAILLFVAPLSRNFAIFCDQAIHQHGGDVLWREIAATMEAELKSGRSTEAILHALNKAGDALAKHFPSVGKNVNELPDEVILD
jgi:uncharacterized membrane protein